MDTSTSAKDITSRETWFRLFVMAAVGSGVAVAVGLAGSWPHAPIAGWAAACAVYVAWVWLVIGRMDADRTARHATREDPARRITDLMVLAASVASLVAIAFVLIQGHEVPGPMKVLLGGTTVASVVLSWLLVHTLYTLRYALLYYIEVDGGVDFNQDQPPKYTDFAYLAFTLGMTFQVSDTNISDPAIRVVALRHALLSYAFGSIILATTVNLVVGLAS